MLKRMFRGAVRVAALLAFTMPLAYAQSAPAAKAATPAKKQASFDASGCFAYARYGGFNPRFAPCNLSVSLLSPPEVNGAVPSFITQACAYLLAGVNLADTSAPIAPNPLGMSIFIVSPALLIVFTSLKSLHSRNRSLDRSDDFSRSTSDATAPSGPPPLCGGHRQTVATTERRHPLIIAAWIGLLTTLIPLWLYHNTGSLQFGWRYLFDAAPMWIILLAAGMQKVTRLKQGLILVSIAINWWGFVDV